MLFSNFSWITTPEVGILAEGENGLNLFIRGAGFGSPNFDNLRRLNEHAYFWTVVRGTNPLDAGVAYYAAEAQNYYVENRNYGFSIRPVQR